MSTSYDFFADRKFWSSSDPLVPVGHFEPHQGYVLLRKGFFSLHSPEQGPVPYTVVAAAYGVAEHRLRYWSSLYITRKINSYTPFPMVGASWLTRYLGRAVDLRNSDRITHCWGCGTVLGGTYTVPHCVGCGWILCYSCGACGCDCPVPR